MKDENAPKGFSGYCIDLINEIGIILKFDYEIVAVPEAHFGYMDTKGKWNGVMKELIEKRADIGLGSMSVMAERENVIDFTVPYYDLVGITIMMRLPESQTSLFKFLTVLESEVWLCILAAYFFTRYVFRFSSYKFARLIFLWYTFTSEFYRIVSLQFELFLSLFGQMLELIINYLII